MKGPFAESFLSDDDDAFESVLWPKARPKNADGDENVTSIVKTSRKTKAGEEHTAKSVRKLTSVPSRKKPKAVNLLAVSPNVRSVWTSALDSASPIRSASPSSSSFATPRNASFRSALSLPDSDGSSASNGGITLPASSSHSPHPTSGARSLSTLSFSTPSASTPSSSPPSSCTPFATPSSSTPFSSSSTPFSATPSPSTQFATPSARFATPRTSNASPTFFDSPSAWSLSSSSSSPFLKTVPLSSPSTKPRSMTATLQSAHPSPPVSPQSQLVSSHSSVMSSSHLSRPLPHSYLSSSSPSPSLSSRPTLTAFTSTSNLASPPSSSLPSTCGSNQSSRISTPNMSSSSASFSTPSRSVGPPQIASTVSTSTSTPSSYASTPSSSRSSSAQPDYLGSLNPQQREAVTADHTPLCVLASAGSGKTKTLIGRILRFLSLGIAAHHILAITFTKKAADEMKARVDTYIGPNRSFGMTVVTFHALCLSILRSHARLINFDMVSVVDAEEQKNIVTEIVKRWEEQQARQGVAQCRRSLVNLTQNSPLASEAAEDSVFDSNNSSGESNKVVRYFVNWIRKVKEKHRPSHSFTGVHQFVFETYRSTLEHRKAVDFQDMIPLVLSLFQKPAVIAEYRATFQYVLCDEFQDVSQAQFDLLCALSEHITVVGDDDQSIYGWRGARVQAFKLFYARFPKARTVVLTQTYRSTGKILQVANSVISRNVNRQSKISWTSNPLGDKVRLMVSQDASKEAKKIARAIVALRESRGMAYRDICVLGRVNSSLFVVADALSKHNIPLRNTATQFKTGLYYKSKEVLDLLAYCDVLYSSAQSDTSLLRVINTPKRKIGGALITKLTDTTVDLKKGLFAVIKLAARGILEVPTPQRMTLSKLYDVFHAIKSRVKSAPQNSSAFAIISSIIEDVNYMAHLAKTAGGQVGQREANVHELLLQAKSFDGKIANDSLPWKQRLQEFCSCVRAGDDRQSNHVVLSTIHQAKGLEWDAVFLIGFNEGVYPLPFQQEEENEDSGCAGADHLEEERRLVYVALSRARATLVLSMLLTDSQGPVEPSRFLNEIPPDLLEPCHDPLSPDVPLSGITTHVSMPESAYTPSCLTPVQTPSYSKMAHHQIPSCPTRPHVSSFSTNTHVSSSFTSSHLYAAANLYAPELSCSTNACSSAHLPNLNARTNPRNCPSQHPRPSTYLQVASPAPASLYHSK